MKHLKDKVRDVFLDISIIFLLVVHVFRDVESYIDGVFAFVGLVLLAAMILHLGVRIGNHR